MISKFAIQAGLGVTAVGGGIGIAVWKLKTTPTTPNSAADDNNSMDSQSSDNSSDDPDVLNSTNSYLVKVPAKISVDDQPTEALKEENKNYFCKWKKTDGNDTDDKTCEIKQIKFDTNKSVLLSDITKVDNSLAFETITNNKLKEKDTWFLLKIKGYNFNLETDHNISNIDIMSTTENKKYSSVVPKFKLENNKAIQGKTKTFLVKHTKDKTNSTIKDFQCKWNDANAKAQECYVYKFETQPKLTGQSINEISLANTVKLNVVVENDNYYIISFKKNTESKIISPLNTNSATIIVVEQENNSNKTVGEFTVINPMIGIMGKTKAENLILLN